MTGYLYHNNKYFRCVSKYGLSTFKNCFFLLKKEIYLFLKDFHNYYLLLTTKIFSNR